MREMKNLFLYLDFWGFEGTERSQGRLLAKVERQNKSRL